MLHKGRYVIERNEPLMPISTYLQALRAKIGHDLLTLTAASACIFDDSGRLLLVNDAETGQWLLPGGGIDADEVPADAAARECWEETGLRVEIKKLLGVFGGPEFRVTYPNGDMAYYTTIAFEACVIGGSYRPDGVEIKDLRYFTEGECLNSLVTPASRVIAACAFARSGLPCFAPATWIPQPH